WHAAGSCLLLPSVLGGTRRRVLPQSRGDLVERGGDQFLALGEFVLVEGDGLHGVGDGQLGAGDGALVAEGVEAGLGVVGTHAAWSDAAEGDVGQGGRESRPQGEGGQVTRTPDPGGMRNADRRNGAVCPARAVQPLTL